MMYSFKELVYFTMPIHDRDGITQLEEVIVPANEIKAIFPQERRIETNGVGTFTLTPSEFKDFMGELCCHIDPRSISPSFEPKSS